MPLRIAALGYYGYGNAGDDRILRVIRESLEPHRVQPIQLPFPGDDEALRRLRHFDFVVIGGGGIFVDGLGQPLGSLDAWASEVDVPLGVLGVGIDRLRPAEGAALDRLLDRSSFFVVRDGASADLVGDPRVRTAPDLTYALPFPARANAGPPPLRRPRCGVSLRHSAAGTGAWAAACRSLPYDLRPYVMSEQLVFGERWALDALGGATAERFSPELLADLDLVVAMTFHSIVFAIQTGVAPLAIGASEKIVRQMQAVGLQRFLLPLDGWSQLADRCAEAVADTASIRAGLSAYTDRAHQEARDMLAGVKATIEDAARPRSRARLPEGGRTVEVVLLPPGPAAVEAGELASSAPAGVPTAGPFATTLRSVERQSHGCMRVSLPASVDLAGLGLSTDELAAITAQGIAIDQGPAAGTGRADYRLVVSAGVALAEDAVETLVAGLEAHPEARGARGALHLLSGEHIEYLRVPGAGPGEAPAPGEEPICQLQRSHPAPGLLPGDDPRNPQAPGAPGPARPCLLVNHGLASYPLPGAFRTFLAAMQAAAFGDAAYAHRCLAGLSPAAVLASPALEADAARLLEAMATAVEPASPFAVVQRCAAVTRGLDRRYGQIARRAMARLAMGRAFEAYHAGHWTVCLRSLGTGVWLDGRWLLRRGVVAMGLRAAAARILAVLGAPAAGAPARAVLGETRR